MCSEEAIFMTDLDGVFTFINNKFTKMYGFTSDEVVGKKTPRILKSGIMDDEVYKTLWDTILDGQHLRNEYSNKTKNNVLIDINGSIDPIIDENDQLIGFLGIQRDISRRKKAEEKEIEAYKKLEIINKIKTEFLLNISHELRTPLTSILAAFEIMSDTLIEDPKNKLNYVLENINISVKRLFRTVQEINEISNLDQKCVITKTGPININDIVDVLIKEKIDEIKISELDVRFIPDEKISLFQGNNDSITQAIGHIIENALVYTKKGKVDIVTKDLPDAIQITITDTGIGIRKEFLKIIYESFSQESTGLSREFQGLGVGLTLAKRYIEANKGKINITSKKNAGTTVVVSFPKK